MSRMAEVERLLDSGKSPDQIAHSLGVKTRSLETACRRAGREDLLARVLIRGLGGVITRDCSVEGCVRGGKIVRGMCRIHYRRTIRRKTTNRPVQSLMERLTAKLVRRPNGCLEWTGLNHLGYGRISVANKTIATHRLAWELANGPIPEGICVCHTCDNPPCCDPAHLFLGTHADNVADKMDKGRHVSGWAKRSREKSVTGDRGTQNE